MKITKEDIVAHADAIVDVLNGGKVCELKIEKGEVTIIEIKRKLKKA